jgi:hypothetical protein
MTIDQTNVVDFIGVDPRTDKVLLLITDHLEWGDDDEFNKLHMWAARKIAVSPDLCESDA